MERARYEKILASTAAFDSRGKSLHDVFCCYLVPESPPDRAWSFEETVRWRRIADAEGRAPHIPFLVVPETEGSRDGPQWQA